MVTRSSTRQLVDSAVVVKLHAMDMRPATAKAVIAMTTRKIGNAQPALSDEIANKTTIG